MKHRVTRALQAGAIALAAWLCGVAPAGATTLIRAGLEQLTASNDRVVLGKVVEVVSYWNSEHNFILTDVRIAQQQVLKGSSPGPELTLTLLGGTVDDLTALIVAGAQLVEGKSYVVFVSKGSLAGAKNLDIIRDHCQGVFEVVTGADGTTRAVSQAGGHPLVADGAGLSDPPGGAEGFPLSVLTRTIRDLARRGAGAPR